MEKVKKPVLLNIGCGAHFCSGWVNIDFNGSSPVIRHDLRQPLPFEAGLFDACYHSHVLEHFDPEAGLALLRECYRVLKPGGFIRVVVPDLEIQIRGYLNVLDASGNQCDEIIKSYNLVLHELFDQFVRDAQGGRRKNISGKPTLLHRGSCSVSNNRKSWFRALSINRARVVRAAILMIGGRKFLDAFDVGLFRTRSGEIHRWAYDCKNLSCALDCAGFSIIKRMSATESAISGFAECRLDTDGNNEVRKPGSLYMEAVKA